MAGRIGTAMDRGPGVEAQDFCREVAHHAGCQPAVECQAVEQQRIVEAPHHHDPVAHRARTIERQPLRILGDRDDRQIKVRRGAAVDIQLRFAHGTPPFGGGEIHVVEANGALQLVGTIPSQEDDGAMRFDELHRRAAMRGRVGQEGNGRGLRSVRHAASRRSAAFRARLRDPGGSAPRPRETQHAVRVRWRPK